MRSALDAISNQEELRCLILQTLREWITGLENNQIRIRIPQLRGQMRLIPGMLFHLRPELFLQLSGETVFQFPEETLRVGPAEICLVPRGMPHQEKVRGLGSPFFNLVFMYEADQMSGHLGFEISPGRPEIKIGIRMDRNISPGLIMLLDEASDFAQTETEVLESGIKGLMIAHLSLLLAQMKGWTSAKYAEPFKVAQARQLVFRHVGNPELSVAFLARQIRCNAEYLSLLFCKAAGMPLKAYINKQRLHRAGQLLENSTLNIAEVSEAAGFRDPSNFTRVFHRWIGKTPSKYRQDFRGRL